MYRMNRAVVATGVLIASTAGLVHCGAGPCAASFLPQQISDTSGQAYYQNAYTLIDLPAEDLVEALPELRGLQPAADQQPLPHILSELGKRVEESYQKFTEVIANEQVTRERCGPACRPNRTTQQEFSYLILPRYVAGLERIDEYRTDAQGKPAQGSTAETPFSEGFASMWALLYPGNQADSKFRYLGQQQAAEHAALVIGFAQRPGWSNVGGKANLEGRTVILLYQGVAWIDVATYRILAIRADLLKPRLDVKLERQTTEIQFGEVHITDAASSALWVPLRVTVTASWNSQVFRDQHLYSNYRLPGANVKIMSAPEEAKPTPNPN